MIQCRVAPVVCVVIAIGLAGCGKTRELRPVTLPDLSRMDPPVQAQTREAYASLTKKLDAAAPDAELGGAFGDYAMILHASEYYDAAEPAYLNARDLAPQDVRWPYYIGHLYKSRGQTADSIASFKRALELRPNEVAILVWLGRLYIEEGQPDVAEPYLTRALAQPPRAVAALAALGQVALAKREYRRAADLFEEALQLQPSTASVHSPLAMAYRGLGDATKAEAHLKQWRNTEILVPDPLRMDLDLVLQSGLSYELRGVRALDARDFTTALDMFRRGLELAPGNTQLSRSLRHKVGTALFLTGDVQGAVAQFEQVTRAAPAEGLDEPSAKANYSLGVVMVSAGAFDQAIDRLSKAVQYNPTYLEARMALADVLRRTGRVADSLPHYAEAVRINPRAAEARFGYAMALVRLRRYREARDWLTEATRDQPDRPELAHALARVLAASPDARVRDGQRAMALVDELFKGQKTTELGETMAMTLAELGDYQQAAAIQRDVMQAAQRAGLERDVTRMAANLRLYERGQPCRTPWTDDDPVHSPGPPVASQ